MLLLPLLLLLLLLLIAQVDLGEVVDVVFWVSNNHDSDKSTWRLLNRPISQGKERFSWLQVCNLLLVIPKLHVTLLSSS
jgi:hypothetical protein